MSSGNFLYSDFFKRTNFSLREQIVPFSTAQSPGLLSLVGLLINNRQP